MNTVKTPVTGGNVSEITPRPATRQALRLGYLTGIAGVTAISLGHLLSLPDALAVRLGFVTVFLSALNGIMLLTLKPRG